MDALGRAIRCQPTVLVQVASKASTLYRPGPPQIKANGKVRETVVALDPLKSIQANIQRQILRRFFYPDYLTGSLPGRDQKKNAEYHAGAAFLFSADIKDFFPSVPAIRVSTMFRLTAHFDLEVSECLAALLLKPPGLPQGATTSPFVANLMLWDGEAALVHALESKGLVYTRFVDDITVSSRNRIAPTDKRWIVSQVYGLLGRCGFKPHRKKEQITTGEARMITTKLTSNTKPGLPIEERRRIRAAVHEQETGAAVPRSSRASVEGRALRLQRFHPGAGAKLRTRLRVMDEP